MALLPHDPLLYFLFIAVLFVFAFAVVIDDLLPFFFT